MSEFRFNGEPPREVFSAAESEMKKLRGTIEKIDATLELLRVDEEALQVLIAESEEFVSIAENLQEQSVADENREMARKDGEALTAVREKMRIIKEGRAKMEAAIARIEAADAALTKDMLADAESIDPSSPKN